MYTEQQTIIDGPIVRDAYLYAYFERINANWISLPMRKWIIQAYTTFGNLTRIGNILPFAQGIHETGIFANTRWVLSYNAGSLGATNDGAWGKDFKSVEEGIFAQYAHLLAYAGKDEQLSYIQRMIAAASPRIESMTKAGYRGIAPTWVGLNNRWAVPGTTYAQAIVTIANKIVAVL